MTAKSKIVSDTTLNEAYNPLELEEEIREFWKNTDIPKKLGTTRKKKNSGELGFVEGPPTLNGVPHVGHARGRVMKDVRYRWKTMQQYYIPFWAGWDCQGLPVELQVEKQLGVKNKRELLDRIGEDRFIQECKKAIMDYHREWVKVDQKLGVFIDQEKAYWTYKDEYIEREWQILKRAWDQGLLEEGHYVVAYCPGCQTSLSSAEVGYEGAYKIVEDPSLYFKFKLTDTQDEFFLVWTTMPFTLITDTMLALHPETEYVTVNVGKEKWILALQRLQPVMQELDIEKYEIVKTVRGRDLEGTKYDYPFKDLIPKQADLERSHPLVHTTIFEDFVDVDTGTGVVHLSPGNGEEDFFAAMKRHVPIFSPFDDEVKFTHDAGAFCGIYARDTDKMVTEELRRRNLLVQAETIRHEYPTCWRSHHKLVWLARKEYFLRTDRINPEILEAAERVDYFYESPKNRFVSFLKEGKPWCISRERVWGAPLPIWKCQKCGEKTIVASKKELLERAEQKPEADFELHKPWVDRLTLRCEKCRGTMRREDFVLDAWHNSGASFYARFSNEEFEKFVPVDFLTEAMDQTRGWANSLLLEHIILTGKPQAPYRSFLLQGLTQDAKGRKMSKSLGNVIEANSALEDNSADVFRFYVLRKCPPIDPNDFDPKELNHRPYQVLSTLYHLSRFFLQNSEFDKFNPARHTLEWAKREKLLTTPDHWLLSRLQATIETYTAQLETCEFNIALATLEYFTIEDLSRLYVPLVRKELWTDDPKTLDRRLAVYAVLWHALKTTTTLFNPITPFLAEALYQKIYRRLCQKLAESINFETWPKPDNELRNKKIEQEFQTLFRTVSLVYAARQSARIKRRWPLKKLVAVAPETVSTSLNNLEELLLDLANVKEIEYASSPPRHVISEKWPSAQENDIKVFLDVRRDQELLGEGLMRDLARRVQALRKELGYKSTDILDVVHISELENENITLLQPYLQNMRELVRTRDLYLDKKHEETRMKWHESQLDDKKVFIAISKKSRK